LNIEPYIEKIFWLKIEMNQKILSILIRILVISTRIVMDSIKKF